MKPHVLSAPKGGVFVNENSMGSICYLIEHLIWTWLALVFFMTHLFSPIISLRSRTFLTIKGSQAGIAATIRKHRNEIQMMLTVLSPYGIYLFFEMFPSLPLYFWCAVLLGVAVILFCAHNTFSAPVRNRKAVWKVTCRRILGFLHSTRFVLTALLALLVTVCGTGALFGISVIDTSKERTYDASKEISYAMEDHALELRQLRSYQWGMISLEQKVETLQLVVDIETAYLGLPDQIEICAEKMGSTTAGGYIHEERRIIINEDYLKYGRSEDCLKTVLHEMFHSYEHHLVSMYAEISDRYRGLLYIRNASGYLYEFNYYVSGSDNYAEYVSQHVEQDSNAYAKDRFEAYAFLFTEENKTSCY